jgi:hypothetical protein
MRMEFRAFDLRGYSVKGEVERSRWTIMAGGKTENDSLKYSVKNPQVSP